MKPKPPSAAPATLPDAEPGLELDPDPELALPAPDAQAIEAFCEALLLEDGLSW